MPAFTKELNPVLTRFKKNVPLRAGVDHIEWNNTWEGDLQDR